MKCKRCGRKIRISVEPNEVDKKGRVKFKNYGYCDSCGIKYELNNKNTFGLTSMVIGIVSIVLSCGVMGDNNVSVLAIMIPIAGFVLSIVGLSIENKKKGFSITGLVCSSISILVCMFSLFLNLVGQEQRNDLNKNINEKTDEKHSEKLDSENNENKEDVEYTEDSDPEEEREIGEERQEITFSDIPWGTSYTEVDSMRQDLGMWPISGDSFKTMSVDDVLLGDYEGIRFEYTDINIIGNTYNGEIEVAGYKTSEVNLYFAYIPVDGVLTKEESDSSFYGAQYIFEPMNLEEMSADLINKLSSIYGDHEKTTEDSDMWGNEYTYTYWYGANDTELVLKTVDSSEDSTGFYNNKIVISYAWRKGDELLQTASDTLKNNAIEEESGVYGNDSVDGL